MKLPGGVPAYNMTSDFIFSLLNYVVHVAHYCAVTCWRSVSLWYVVIVWGANYKNGSIDPFKITARSDIFACTDGYHFSASEVLYVLSHWIMSFLTKPSYIIGESFLWNAGSTSTDPLLLYFRLLTMHCAVVAPCGEQEWCGSTASTLISPI